MKIRPDGFDFNTPDPEEWRCPSCNHDGMNRTGWRPLGYIGSSTTTVYAVTCGHCVNGIRRYIAEDLEL